ncbi:MAG: Lrp/AsnC family transcriptional regulator [Candidatus Micrarchaeota archaeon]|nr:Lrp/AsnC family transcriptional regulator [Candidatus Micrarchaeota archaeon]
MQKLDLLDRKILYELDLDARQPISELAGRLHVSRETAAFRLRRLVKNHVVSNFYTIFDITRMGAHFYKIYLKFRNIAPEKEEGIMAHIKAQKNLIYLAEMEGHYDCVVVLMIKDPRELTDFLHPFMKSYGHYVQEKEIVVFLCTHRLNQRFFYNGNRKTDRRFSLSAPMADVDAADLKIMHSITRNARLPIIDMAKAAGLDPSVVSYRLKRLQKDGVILGYAVAVNWEEVGLEFIQLNISLVDPSAKQRMINYFDATDKCLFAFEVVGKYDLVIEIFVKGGAELQEIMNGFRRIFSEKCYDCDVSTITREHVVLWLPTY